jgi:hypothetical protein
MTHANLTPAQLARIARGHEAVARELRLRAAYFEVKADLYRAEADHAKAATHPMRAAS